MKHPTLALIALAAAFVGQTSLALADEADPAEVEIVVVTGQRLAETDRQPAVDIDEPRVAIDFSALAIAPPEIDCPSPALEPPRIELALADAVPERG